MTFLYICYNVPCRESNYWTTGLNSSLPLKHTLVQWRKQQHVEQVAPTTCSSTTCPRCSLPPPMLPVPSLLPIPLPPLPSTAPLHPAASAPTCSPWTLSPYSLFPQPLLLSGTVLAPVRFSSEHRLRASIWPLPGHAAVTAATLALGCCCVARQRPKPAWSLCREGWSWSQSWAWQ